MPTNSAAFPCHLHHRADESSARRTLGVPEGYANANARVPSPTRATEDFTFTTICTKLTAHRSRFARNPFTSDSESQADDAESVEAHEIPPRAL